MGLAIGRMERFLALIRERRCVDCVRKSYDREFGFVLVDECSTSRRTEKHETKKN
jgi:hypothetical protein